MTKNVTYIIRSFPEQSETFIVSSIVETIKSGYNVSIYTRKFLGKKNTSQLDLINKYKLFDKTIRPIKAKENKIYNYLYILFSIFINPRLFYYYLKFQCLAPRNSIRNFYKIKTFGKIDNNDVLHVHFSNSLNEIIPLYKIGFLRQKIIVTFHGYDAFGTEREAFWKKYGNLYENFVCYVTCNSSYLRNRLIELGISRDQIRVVPIGVDVDIFKGSPKKILSNTTINLLSVGRLIQLKGQIYAIKAINVLLEEGYDIKLRIIGSGNNLNQLKEYVAKANLEDKVVFEGSKSQSAVKDAMKESDIFLMTSTFDDFTKRREAFGLVSVEAQAMGLPVIGFNSGGLVDTLINANTGYLVEDRNYLELANKIKFLIDNPEVYRSMSDKAVSFAHQNFNLSNTNKKYLALYNGV